MSAKRLTTAVTRFKPGRRPRRGIESRLPPPPSVFRQQFDGQERDQMGDE